MEGDGRTVPYEVEVVQSVLIPVKGGDLAADLYLPRGAPPAPALINLLPYNKDWAAGAENWGSHTYFASHGYPSLLVDFRGTGASSGCARAPFDREESEDGLAAIAWASSQPWCNGRIGMWGMSYGAITTLRTASLRPATLKAIIPIMGALDPEHDFVHPCGRRGLLSSLTWGLQNLLTQLIPPLHMDAEGRWRKVWDERLRQADPYVVDLIKHTAGDPVWRQRIVDARRIEVPSMCIIGWRDLFAEGMMCAFEQISATKRLVAGPWMHTLPQTSSFHAIDILPLMLGWWDRWLREIGTDDKEQTAATVFIQGADRWKNFPVWPPLGIVQETWYASSVGDLIKEASTVTDAVTIKPDPTVGTGAGLQSFPADFGRPTDQRDDDQRSICFTTLPLKFPLRICGRARLLLRSPQAPCSAAIVAKLSHVYPDGRSLFVTAGLPAILDPKVDRDCEILFAPTTYEIAAGHQLRLSLASADFPRLWPESSHPGLWVSCGGETGTTLILPTLSPTEGFDVAMNPLDPKAASPPQLINVEQPEYRIDRTIDPSRVDVTVSFGESLRSIDSVNKISYSVVARAWVEKERPGDAGFTGSATATIDSNHEPIGVRAELSVTKSSACARGTVEINNRAIWCRQWKV